MPQSQSTRFSRATEETVAEVKSMDHSFNLIHGSGASLNDETMKDPTTTTAHEIQKNCPDINQKVIRYFTKVKYFAKMFREVIKDGHFSNI